MSVNPSNLIPGDKISLYILDGTLTHARTATVIGIDPFNETGHIIIIALDKPYQGSNGFSHNEIWENPLWAKSARFFRVPYQEGISWWIDEYTTITKILEPCPEEFPCKLCKRKNYINVKSCWWCGVYPFPE